MTRILIGIGLAALFAAPAMAADGFRSKVVQFKKEPWGGTAFVRIENRTRHPNYTWLEIQCVAKKGLRKVVGQDFGWFKGSIHPGGETTVAVALELHGGRADRAGVDFPRYCGHSEAMV